MHDGCSEHKAHTTDWHQQLEEEEKQKSEVWANIPAIQTRGELSAFEHALTGRDRTPTHRTTHQTTATGPTARLAAAQMPARHKRHGSRFVQTNHAHLLLFCALQRRFGLRLLLLFCCQALLQHLRFGVFEPLLRLVLL
jgi:hypothetical protein